MGKIEKKKQNEKIKNRRKEKNWRERKKTLGQRKKNWERGRNFMGERKKKWEERKKNGRRKEKKLGKEEEKNWGGMCGSGTCESDWKVSCALLSLSRVRSLSASRVGCTSLYTRLKAVTAQVKLCMKRSSPTHQVRVSTRM